MGHLALFYLPETKCQTSETLTKEPFNQETIKPKAVLTKKKFRKIAVPQFFLGRRMEKIKDDKIFL